LRMSPSFIGKSFFGFLTQNYQLKGGANHIKEILSYKRLKGKDTRGKIHKAS